MAALTYYIPASPQQETLRDEEDNNEVDRGLIEEQHADHDPSRLNSFSENDQQLQSPSQLAPGEEWRQSRRCMVESHIAWWTLLDHSVSDENNKLIIATREDVISYTLPGPHRALSIPEILENILSYLNRPSLIAAAEVCRTWCDVIAYMLRLYFRGYWPCAPIEYGQILVEHVPSRIPSQEDLDGYVWELLNWGNHPDPTWKPPFRPACYHQDLSIPPAAADAFRSLYWYRDISSIPECQWLDLSQLEINPYFTDIFNEHIRLRGGLLELRLLPGNTTRSNTACIMNAPGFQKVVSPMFVTQPPCKALGFYLHVSDRFTRLDLLRNEEGINIGELMHKIHQTLPKVQSTWAKEILTVVEEEDADPSDPQKTKAWHSMIHSISPRMIILLESFGAPKDNLSNEGYGRYHTVWREAYCEWHRKNFA